MTIALLAVSMIASAQDTKVFVTESGKKFHTHKECGYIKNSTSVKEVSKAQAEKDGKTICSRCNAKDKKNNK